MWSLMVYTFAVTIAIVFTLDLFIVLTGVTTFLEFEYLTFFIFMLY